MIKFIFNKKAIIFFTVFVFVAFLGKIVLATPPVSFYEPGEELNPSCLPSDTNCNVRPPITSLNIDDTVYGAGWSADTTHAPSKNAIYNHIQTLMSLAGGIMTGGITNSTSINPLTTLAESWIGPSSTAGIYFKGGNVGIGTATPTSRLSVHSIASATSALKITDDTYYTLDIGYGASGLAHIMGRAGTSLGLGTNGSEKIRIDSSGNVGIGIMTPTSKLDVAGNIRLKTAYDPWLILESSAASSRKSTIFYKGAGGSNLWSLQNDINENNAQNFGIKDESASAFRLMIDPSGYVGIGTSSPGAKLQVGVVNQAANYGTGLLVYGGDGGSGTTLADFKDYGGTTALSINGQGTTYIKGSVGIGTTSPGSLLSLAGSTGSALNVSLTPSGWGTLTHRLGVQYSGNALVLSTNALLTSATAGNLDDVNEASSALILGASGTFNFTSASPGANPRTFSSALFIDSAQNVGIGTTSPIARLTVAVPATNTVASLDVSNSSGITIAGTGNSTNSRLQFGIGDSTLGPYGAWIQSSFNQSDSIYGNKPLLLNPNGGNVGIGEIAPGAILTLAGGGIDDATVEQLRFGRTGLSTTYYNSILSGSGGTHNSLQFNLSNTAGTSVNVMTLRDGNVGIGTTGPTAKLDVAGGIQGYSLTDTGNGFFQLSSGVKLGSGIPIQWSSTSLYSGALDLSLSRGAAGKLYVGNGTNGDYSGALIAGNVGIGTTSPGVQLDIKNLTAGNAGYIRLLADDGGNVLYTGKDNSDNSWLYGYDGSGNIDYAFYAGSNSYIRTGNLGVGTTAPVAKLDVRTANVIPANSTFGILNVGTTDVQAAGLGGSITLSGMNTNDALNQRVWAELAGRKENSTTGNNAAYFSIGVNTAAGTLTERMRIDSAGNVGIGTTSPTTGLVVANGSIQVTNGSVSPTTGSGLEIYGGSSPSLLSYNRGTSGYLPLGLNSSYLAFSNSGTEAMRITSGNVGIGTTGPTAQLQVNTATAETKGLIVYGVQGSQTANLQEWQGINGVLGYVSATGLFSSGTGGFHTSAATGYQLNNGRLWQIKGDSTSFNIYDGSDGQTRLTVLGTSGNVGIGTVSPAYKLDVQTASIASQDALALRASDGDKFFSVSTDSSGNTIMSLYGSTNDVRSSFGYSNNYIGGNLGVGIVGTPSITLAIGDADTGIKQVSDGVLAVYSNNSEKVRIQSDGNVGIGTTGPAGQLHVNIGAAATKGLIVQGAVSQSGNLQEWQNSAGTVLSKIDSSGNMVFLSGGANMTLTSNGSGGIISSYAQLLLYPTNYDSTVGALKLTAASNVVTVAGSYNGNTGKGDSLLFTGGSWGGGAVAGDILFRGGGGGTDTKGNIRFQSADGTTDYVYINNQGNVGIGTTGPLASLHVKNTNDTASLLTLETGYGSPSGQKSITWRDATNVTGQIDTRYSGGIMSMVFGHLYNSGYQTGDLVTIKGDGNVGIGTTSPSQLLTVGNNNQFTVTSAGVINSTGLNIATGNIAVTTGNITVQNGSFGHLANAFWINSAALKYTSTGIIGFTNSANAQDAASVALSLGGAGKMYVGNGTSGDYTGTLIAGNVGIGTTSPAALLSLGNGTGAAGTTAALGMNFGDPTANLYRSGAGTIKSDGSLSVVNLTGSGYIQTNDFRFPNNGYLRGTSPGVFTWSDATLASFGRLNFGGTSSSFPALALNGSALQVIGADGSGNANLLITGNVGIGTTAPGAKLDVVSADNTTATNIASFRANNLSQGVGIGFQDIRQTGAGIGLNINSGGGGLNLENTSGGNVNFPGSGRWQSDGNVGIGTTTPGAKLDIYKDVGPGANVMRLDMLATGAISHQLVFGGNPSRAAIGTFTNSDLAFFTNNAADQLYLKSGGNVGIGTTSPGEKLEVASGNIEIDPSYMVGTRDGFAVGGSAGQIDFGIKKDSADNRFSGMRVLSTQYSAPHLGGEIAFFTDKENVILSTERMRIDYNGNVGIGTTTPAAKLNVYAADDTGGMFRLENQDSGPTNSSAMAYLLRTNNQSSPTGLNAMLRLSDHSSNVPLYIEASDTSAPLFIVKGNGNVGIGTASPGSAKLNVSGGYIAVDNAQGYRIAKADGVTYPWMLYAGSDNIPQIGSGSWAGMKVSGGTGDTVFTNGVSGVTETMRILNNGNVGIGTTDPSVKLHISENKAGLLDLRVDNTNTGTGNSTQSRIVLKVGSQANGVAYGMTANGSSYGGNAYFWNMENSAFMFATNNAEQMRLSATGGLGLGSGTYLTTDPGAGSMIISGNVGIGTTNPTAKLTVHTATNINAAFRVLGAGSGGANALDMYSINDAGNAYAPLSFNGSQIVFNTDSGGNVGIGTTGPADKLDVSGRSRFVLEGSTTNGFHDYSAIIGYTTTGTAADGIGSILRFAQENSAGTLTGSADIGSILTTATAGSERGAIVFRLLGASGLVEKVRIDSLGNVGIGTTGPADLLEVSASGSAGLGGRITITNSAAEATNNEADLGFRTSSSYTGALYTSRIVSLQAAGSNQGNLAFFNYNGGAAAGTEMMRLTSTGNVGIGTTSPGAKLHIAQNVNGAAVNLLLENSRGPDGVTIDDSVQLQFGVAAGYPTSGIIEVLREGAYSVDSNRNAAMAFYTMQNAVSSEKMRITSTGNVGIGTTSPQALLHVSGNTPVAYFEHVGGAKGKIVSGAAATLVGTENNFGLQLQVNNTTRVGIDTNGTFAVYPNYGQTIGYAAGTVPPVNGLAINGNVGIGTTNPQAKLDVNGTSFFGTSGSTLGQTIIDISGGARFYQKSLSDSSVKTLIQSDGVSYINGGNVGIGTTSPSANLQVAVPTGQSTAGILISQAGATGYAMLQLDRGATNRTSAVQFSTLGSTDWYAGTIYNGGSNNSSWSLATGSVPSLAGAVLTVQTNGNVGIGTTGPQSILDVYGNAPKLFIRDSGSQGARLSFATAGATTADSEITHNVSIGNGMEFRTGGAGIATRMVITSTGNVGIGTTSPSQKLDVYGSAIIRGTYWVGESGYQVGENGTALLNQISLYRNNPTPSLTTPDLYGAGGNLVLGGASNGTGNVIMSGNVGIGTTSPSGILHVKSPSSTKVVVQAGVSQSGNLMEWQNSSGGVMNYIPATGGFTANNAIQQSTNAQMDYSGVVVANSLGYNWSSTAAASGVKDTSISRLAANKIAVGNGTAGDYTGTLIVGNVGIGTTSPNVLLTIGGSDATGAANGLNFSGDTTANLYRNSIGTIRTDGNLAVGTTIYQGGFASKWAQEINGNDLRFYDYNNTAGYRLTLQSGGNVGIGTTSPDSLLTMGGQVAPTLHILSTSGGAANAGEIRFTELDVNYGALIRHNASLDALQFLSLSNTVETPRMTIEYTGSVGIGTTNPATQLHLYNSQGALRIESVNTDSRLQFKSSSGSWTVGNAIGTATDLFQIVKGIDTADTKLVIDTNGNVGIGTTSPGYKLDVQNTSAGAQTTVMAAGNLDSTAGTAALFRLYASAGPTSNTNGIFDTIVTRQASVAGSVDVNYLLSPGNGNVPASVMYLKGSGNVGIGTTSPGTTLEVYAASPFSGTSYAASTRNLGNLTITTSDAQGQDVGGILALGGNRGSTGYGVFGGIRGAKENSTDGNNSGYLGLYTSQSGVAFAERMRITSTGNVGIGTTSPGTKLDVYGTSDVSNGLVRFMGDSLTTPSFFTFGRISTVDLIIGSVGTAANLMTGTVQGDAVVRSSTGKLHLGVGYSAPSMTFINGGNVGIGTTSPSQLLTVGNNNQFTVNSSGNVVVGAAGTNGQIRITNDYSSAVYGLLYSDATGSVSLQTVNADLKLVGGARSSWSAWGGGWAVGISMFAQNPMTYSGGTTTFVPMSATFANSAASSEGLALGFVYNQTGTAGSTDLLINRTENALGSGAHYLMQAQVAGVSKFVIQNSGNVGIGTTSPTELLSLGNGAARKFWIENTTTDVVGRALTVAAGGTVAGTSVSNVVGGNLILQAGLGTGTGASTISFQNGTTLTTGTTLQTMSTKMTILGNGNVGVGTATPVSKLVVDGGALPGDLLIKGTSDGSQYSNFFLADTTNPGTSGGHVWSFSHRSVAANANAFMIWNYNGTFYRNTLNIKENGDVNLGGSYVESDGSSAYLNIIGGNVGVGIASPSDLLHLNTGNLRIGASTATRATTAGTNQLILFDGTAPVGTLANGISMYSTGGEAYIMDAAGNATLQSPHENENNYWVFDSKNSYTGKNLLVDMELMMKKLNETFGWDYVHETIDGVATPRSGVVALDVELAGIKERLAVLEGSTAGGDSGLLGSIVDSFNSVYGAVWENGILKIANIVSDKLTTKELCLEDVCITKTQLKELLEKNNINNNANLITTTNPPQANQEVISTEENIVSENSQNENTPTEEFSVSETENSSEILPEESTLNLEIIPESQ